MIEFRGVNKWFGSLHVLKNINLTIKQGEVVVVCGPSGSGKSTLIRCINKLEPIQKGEIIVDGMSLNDPKTDITKLRAEVGMVFQQFNLYPHKTALENIILAPIKGAKTVQGGGRKNRYGPDGQSRAFLKRSTVTRLNCPEASSSGWRLPGPWPCNPRSCSSTSPLLPWTRR